MCGIVTGVRRVPSRNDGFLESGMLVAELSDFSVTETGISQGNGKTMVDGTWLSGERAMLSERRSQCFRRREPAIPIMRAMPSGEEGRTIQNLDQCIPMKRTA